MDLRDHPLLIQVQRELHARPFPAIQPPCKVLYLALAREDSHNADTERAFLFELLDHFSVQKPNDDCVHLTIALNDRLWVKWELHTEFVGYMWVYPSEDDIETLIPKQWVKRSPGSRLTSIAMEIAEYANSESLQIRETVLERYQQDSLAAAEVVDGTAIVATDFRQNAQGHIPLSVWIKPGASVRRVGRITQRLIELETYKVASMHALPLARSTAKQVAELNAKLSAVVENMVSAEADPQALLLDIQAISAKAEVMSSQTAFRFGAAMAYESIVHERVAVLREQRFRNFQLFSEFLLRRYDPAMRTCQSTKQRLDDLSERAERAANLLRTRVDVDLAASNRALLMQLNQRSEDQLRLQTTVEGLSVVAISYYAISIVGYLIAPVAKAIDIDKAWLMGAVALPTMGLVYWGLQRIKKRFHSGS
ncbi:MAG: DUF3422 domain-containing protein [Gammaproteobacteria bacterium]|nr:DUF3422 domain-containing protein [Gammaproteobacteria bacterium]